MSGRVPQQRAAAAAGAGPAYRQGPPGSPGGQQVVEGPEVIDGPVYYDARPPAVYYGGPYYRPYYWGGWGWRRRW